MIEFHKLYNVESAKKYIDDVLNSGHIEGDGQYTKLCETWLKDTFSVQDVMMMTSCTHALECAIRVLNLNENDEVIVPSFTFPSTANAVILGGGKVVFSEVKEEDLTIDPHKIIDRISEDTKAIIVVHYGGVSCDMDLIMNIANKHKLIIIEDCAQSFLTKYGDQYTGTIGHFGCFSFHGTKDFTAGEGGALIVNDDKYADVTRIFRQKGTNRDAFINGKVNYYQWVHSGSSYSPTELAMALLYSQLLQADEIIEKRRKIYNKYQEFLIKIVEKYGLTERIKFSSRSENDVNGHMFYLLFKEVSDAKDFEKIMKNYQIDVRTHFVPLHQSAMGKTIVSTKNLDGSFEVEKSIEKRLLRLPLFPSLLEKDIEMVLDVMLLFLKAIRIR